MNNIGPNMVQNTTIYCKIHNYMTRKYDVNIHVVNFYVYKYSHEPFFFILPTCICMYNVQVKYILNYHLNEIHVRINKRIGFVTMTWGMLNLPREAIVLN